ncbi:hypothetical protein MBLNU457_g2940t1 [Dothideomycetes sp. NU457]
MTTESTTKKAQQSSSAVSRRRRGTAKKDLTKPKAAKKPMETSEDVPTDVKDRDESQPLTSEAKELPQETEGASASELDRGGDKAEAPVDESEAEAAAAKFNEETALLIQQHIYSTKQGFTRQGLETITAALSKQVERHIKKYSPEELSPEYMIKCIKGKIYMMCPINHMVQRFFAMPRPAYPGGEWKRPIETCCSDHFEGFGRYVVRWGKEIRTEAQWDKAENDYKRYADIHTWTMADHNASRMMMALREDFRWF